MSNASSVSWLCHTQEPSVLFVEAPATLFQALHLHSSSISHTQYLAALNDSTATIQALTVNWTEYIQTEWVYLLASAYDGGTSSLLHANSSFPLATYSSHCNTVNPSQSHLTVEQWQQKNNLPANDELLVSGVAHLAVTSWSRST